MERKKGKTKGCGVSAAQRRAILQGTCLWMGWSPALHPEQKTDMLQGERGMLREKPGREDSS